MALEKLTGPEWDIDEEDALLRKKLSEGDDTAYALLILGEDKAREEGLLPYEPAEQLKQNSAPVKPQKQKTRKPGVSLQRYANFLQEVEQYLSRDSVLVEEKLRELIKGYFPKRYKAQNIANLPHDTLWGIARHIADYARDRFRDERN